MEIVNENKNKQEEKVSLSSPLFAVIYDKTRLKMAELEEKNKKIVKKNEKTQVKMERAEYIVNLAKQIKDTPAITKNIPFPVMKLLEVFTKQEEDKYKSFKSKLEKRADEISSNSKKISKYMIDIETCVSVDKFVENLKSPTGKKEIFIKGLQEFNDIAIKKAENKIANIDEKIAKASEAKSKTHSMSERIKLDNKIKKLTSQKEILEKKIKGFNGIGDKIKAVENAPQEKVEKVIEKSCDGIVSAATENPDKFAKNQAETVVKVCNDVIDEELPPPVREQETSEELKEVQEVQNNIVDDELPLPLPVVEQEPLEEVIETAENIQEIQGEVINNKLPAQEQNTPEYLQYIVARLGELEKRVLELSKENQALKNKATNNAVKKTKSNEPPTAKNSFEYKRNLSEADIKQLLSSNIKFEAKKDDKNGSFTIKYKKDDSNNINQILNRTPENSLKRWNN